MLHMWAKRYITIAKKSGVTEARAWASQYVPSDATATVKKLIERTLGINRN